MSRREFIAVSGAALMAGAAVSAAARVPAQPEAAPKRTLRKAVMIGMVAEGKTILEKFQLLKDLGFDGCEIDCPTKIPTEEFLDAQEKTGVKAHGVVHSQHWQFHLNSGNSEIRAKCREALETCLREGKKLGSTSVLFVPAVVNAEQSYADAYRITQEEIRKVLPLAEETGVTIAIENVWNNFLLSPIEATRYVDEMNHPRLKFHFDIGNVINFGFPDQWIRTLGNRIVKLHIKDFSRKKRDEQGLWKGFDVQLGEGDAGWAKVMKALDATGYSTATIADGGGNWATAEVGGGGRERLKQVKEQMDRLLAM